MAVNLSPLGGAGAQFFTNDGVPLTGGLLYTYLAGTSTPATTYTSSTGVTALANPIILDAAGRVPTGEIWLTDGISYKFVLKDSTDVLIATWDGLSGINSNFIAYTAQEETATATAGQTVFNLSIAYIPGANNLAVFVNGSNQVVNANYLETDENTVTFLTGLNVGDVVKFSTATPISANTVSAVDVGYTPAGTGAVSTNVQAKLRQYVSVKDFGATGDGSTNDTAAAQAASAANVGGDVFFPAGTYLFSSDITFACNVIMDSDAKIITSNKLIFSAGFEAPLAYCLDASGFVQFNNIVEIYPQWFGAIGDAVYASGSITSSSTTLTISSPSGLSGGANAFQNGDTIYIMGAGTAGAVLQTTIVSGAGTSTVVIANSAITTVNSRAVATKNDTVALQRFFASVKAGIASSTYGASQPSSIGCTKLYVPTGTYCSFDEITMYSGCVLEGQFGNTLGGTRIVQCNREAPLINVLADNFNSGGSSTNGGNGNNIFRNINFNCAEIDDTQTNPNLINFQYAWNIHSDTEFDHVIWQNTAGACVGGGFVTTGTISSGSTTLTLADGSVFRTGNVGGGKLTIVGAGVAGANLDVYIVSGGGTNTVTVSTAASTSVTSAVVYPQSDLYGLKINDCEMDVCRAGFAFVGNSSGSLVINNLLAFYAIRGAIRVSSVGEWDIVVTDSYFDGCGNPTDGTDSTWRNGIYVVNAYTGKMLIDTCIFKKNAAFGGRILYQGKNLTIRNSRFTDLDSFDIDKFVRSLATETIIQDNQFSSSSIASYTNARLLTLVYPSATVIKITDNIFENTSATAYQNFIQADYALNVCDITNNTFKGLVTVALSSNLSDYVNNIVLNRGYNPVQRYGSAAPVANSWDLGSIIWNTAPASGGNIGWVNTTAGTFGTLSGVTGSITSGSNSLTVNTTTGLTVGNYIAIVGVTGAYLITFISGTTVTLNANSNATVTSAAVSYVTPVWKTFGTIA